MLYNVLSNITEIWTSTFPLSAHSQLTSSYISLSFTSCSPSSPILQVMSVLFPSHFIFLAGLGVYLFPLCVFGNGTPCVSLLSRVYGAWNPSVILFWSCRISGHYLFQKDCQFWVLTKLSNKNVYFWLIKFYLAEICTILINVKLMCTKCMFVE